MIKKLTDFFWGRIPIEISTKVYPQLFSKLKHHLDQIEYGTWVGRTSVGGMKEIFAKDIYDLFSTMDYKTLPAELKDGIEKLHPKFKIYDEHCITTYNKFSDKVKPYLENVRQTETQILQTFFSLTINENFEYGKHGLFKFFKINERDFKLLKKEIYRDADFRNYKKIRGEILNEGKPLLKEISQHYNGDLLSPERRQITLTGVTIFLTLVLAGCTIWTVLMNQGLIENQLELNNKLLESISPLKPTLEVSLDSPEDKRIAVWEIAKINRYSDDENEDVRKKTIRFILSNIGRMRTGRIDLKLEGPIIREGKGDINNIIGESSEFLQMKIWHKECEMNFVEVQLKNGSIEKRIRIKPECDYTNTEIPLGWHKYNLTIYCPFCAEKEKVHELELCFFDDNEESREVCNVK